MLLRQSMSTNETKSQFNFTQPHELTQVLVTVVLVVGVRIAKKLIGGDAIE